MRLSPWTWFAPALLALLPPVLLAEDREEENPLALLEEAFERAAQSVAPAVVQVYVERAPEERPDRETGDEADPAYFVRPDAPVSGVLVDPSGLVVTSAWNVAGEIKRVQVTLADGRTFEARRLGWDEIRDLALLEIDAEGLPAASIDAAPDLSVGQWAIVVGRSESVSRFTQNTGIVSATTRNEGTNFQIDARTNYGSAGGAVVDIHGRLIGIASRVADRSSRGQNSGVGFATPVSLLALHLPEYRKGTVIKVPPSPFLGIRADQSALDLDGVRVAQVILGTAAESAGLTEGDVIIEIDAAPVHEFDDLVRGIRKAGAGAKIQIKFRRGDEVKTAEATIGVRPAGE